VGRMIAQRAHDRNRQPFPALRIACPSLNPSLISFLRPPPALRAPFLLPRRPLTHLKLVVPPGPARHIVEEVGGAIHLHDDGEGRGQGGLGAGNTGCLRHQHNVLDVDPVVDLLERRKQAVRNGREG
jgi:hypothetical protein